MYVLRMFKDFVPTVKIMMDTTLVNDCLNKLTQADDF